MKNVSHNALGLFCSGLVTVHKHTHSPHQVLRFQGRSCRRHSDEWTGKGRWGRRRTLAGCRCHGERPVVRQQTHDAITKSTMMCAL